MALNLVVFALAAASVLLVGSVKKLPLNWLPLLIMLSLVCLYTFLDIVVSPAGGMLNAKLAHTSFLMMCVPLLVVFARALQDKKILFEKLVPQALMLALGAGLFVASMVVPVHKNIVSLVWLIALFATVFSLPAIWTNSLPSGSKCDVLGVKLARVISLLLVVPFVITAFSSFFPPDNFFLAYPSFATASQVTTFFFLLIYIVLVRHLVLFVAALRAMNRPSSQEMQKV